MNEWLQEATGWLDELPASALIVVVLIVIGYVLKVIKWIPNRLIPLALMLAGAVIYALIGEPGKVDPSFRHPTFVLALHGVVLAFIAWLIHNKGLKRLENKIPILKGFLPDTGDSDPKAFVKAQEENTKPKESKE